MDIQRIMIRSGQGKDGSPEEVDQVELEMGNIVSIVGPTGCGKTTLINDIELFANRNTPSGRQVLINGNPVPDDFTFDPAKHPIALISQHTNFLSDLPVGEFLAIHAKVRGADAIGEVVDETIGFANQLKGEAIITICMEEMKKESERLSSLTNTLKTWLFENYENGYINGHEQNSLPGHLNFSFHGLEGETIRLLLLLDELGIAVSAGSACSSNHGEGASHFLQAIGLNPLEERGGIRVSVGRFTAEKDIRSFTDALKQCIPSLNKIFSR